MKRAVFLLLGALATATASQPADTPSLPPSMDPGREMVAWNGKNWNIADNRLFESRFEKYLSTPSDTNHDTTEHFKVLSRIRELLSPLNASIPSKEEAFRLLKKASEFHADDLLSDTIASQVHAAWLAQNNSALLQSATATLEKERKRLEWNLKVAAEARGVSPDASAVVAGREAGATLEMQQIAARLAEVNLLLKNSRLKTEVSLAQARTEFQVLIVQLFVQRRFHHVLIATRFYRSIFADGSSQQLHFGEQAQNLFAKTTGNAPTLTSLDSLCGALISEAHDGVKAFRELLANDELESATKRLSEAFLIGEYLTSLDVVAMPEKHRALVFLHKSRHLLHALEAKDFTLAEKLVAHLQRTAKDYDTSAANAAIETAKTASAMHLAKARNAAVSGNQAAQESELLAATEIWPTNPALAEVAAGIYRQENLHARAIAEFDQLVGQRSWREIYENRMHFVPALETLPDKQARLANIIDTITMVDRTIARAKDLEKRGEPVAAWESAEILSRQIPEEYPRLIRLRADLTPGAADYVKAVQTAEELEGRGERGSSLFWYLKAHTIHPGGEIAKAGIQRLNHLILPDSW